MSAFIKEYYKFFIGGGFAIFFIFIGVYWHKFQCVEKDLPLLKEQLEAIRKLLFQLVTHLKGQVNIPESFVQSFSPNSLTDAGIKMMEESGLKNIIDTHKDSFIKEVESKKPPTNYDIEQLCCDILLSHKDDELFKPTKEYAFNHGIDLILMLYAAAIYLRDLVLSKNISIKEQ